jgi:uncharacterized protein YjiS (DUF1127 family)
MSTSFNTTTTVPLIPSGRLDPRAYQSSSWPTVAALPRVLRLWAYRARQRAALSDLADNKYLLDDIGVTREQALGQARKPFWR